MPRGGSGDSIGGIGQYYFSVHKLPELQDVPRRERKRIVAKGIWKGLFSFPVISLTVGTAIIVTALLYASMYLHPYGLVIAFMAWPIVLIGFGVLVRMIAMNIARPHLAELAEEYRGT